VASAKTPKTSPSPTRYIPPSQDIRGPRLTAEDFIARWQGVTASELATAQSFVIDHQLCR